jgi:hypothetical protein
MLSRIGTWLRATLRKEQAADPEWAEDESRRRSGKMGEDIVTDDSESAPEEQEPKAGH